jgi:hypothetical protein
MKITHKIIKYLALIFAISIIYNIINVGLYLIFNTGNLFDGVTFKEEKLINEKVDLSNKNITSLDINLKYSKLTIIKSNKFKIENNSKYIVWEYNNNKLNISEVKNNYNLFKKIEREIIVYIPENITFDEINIYTGTGIIEIDTLNSKNLALEIGVGKVNIKNLNIINKAIIIGGVGDVSISSGQINNLDLEVGVGDFDIATILTGENNINSGVGDLDIDLMDELANYTIRAEKGIGTIKLNEIEMIENISYGNGKSYIELEGGVGDINIK